MPSIQVRIKVQHPDRLAVDLLERSEGCQRERVVASQRHQLGPLQKTRGRLVHAKLAKGCRHLRERHGVVHWRDWDVTAVDDLCPVLVRVDICTGVEATKGGLSA